MLSQRAKILALVGNFTQQEIESMMLDIQPSYDKYNTGIICLPNVLIGSVIDECTV
jgi:hypothetical protein